MSAASVRLRFRVAQVTPDTLRPGGLRVAAPRVARQGEAWWGKKDSNLRSHKTADLQSAPFATRDTPPLNSIATHPPKWRRTRPRMTLKPRTRSLSPGWARLWGNRPGKVNQRTPLIRGLGRSNCHNPEPVTQACHQRSRSQAKIPARRRQSPREGPRIRPPAGLARPRRRRRGTCHFVWLAHGGGGAGKSAAPYPQALVDGKCRAASRRRKHRNPRGPGDRAAVGDRPT